jgi:hypothetical protein
MNLFRTGNLVLDTTFSMIVPIFFSTLNTSFTYIYRTLDNWIMDFLFPEEDTTVDLEYEVTRSVIHPPHLSLLFLVSSMKTVGEISVKRRLARGIMSFRKRSWPMSQK